MGLKDYFEERTRKEEEEKAKEDMLRDMRKKEAEKIIKRHTGDDETFAEHYGCKPVEPVTEEKIVEGSRVSVEAEPVAPWSTVKTDELTTDKLTGPNEPDDTDKDHDCCSESLSRPWTDYVNNNPYNNNQYQYPPTPSYSNPSFKFGKRSIDVCARFMDSFLPMNDNDTDKERSEYFDNRYRLMGERNERNYKAYASGHAFEPTVYVEDQFEKWIGDRLEKVYDICTVNEVKSLCKTNISSSRANVESYIKTLQRLVDAGVFDDKFDLEAAKKADEEILTADMKED